MTSRRQDFLSTAVEQLRYHGQKLESAATHMMAACASSTGCIFSRIAECNYYWQIGRGVDTAFYWIHV